MSLVLTSFCYDVDDDDDDDDDDICDQSSSLLLICDYFVNEVYYSDMIHVIISHLACETASWKHTLSLSLLWHCFVAYFMPPFQHIMLCGSGIVLHLCYASVHTCWHPKHCYHDIEKYQTDFQH